MNKDIKQKVLINDEKKNVDASLCRQSKSEAGTLSFHNDLTVRKRAEYDSDGVFSFIRKEHLQEAQEFRSKGYNSHVPEVEPGLLMKLQKAIVNFKSHLCPYAYAEMPLDILWLLDQIRLIKGLADKLSDDGMQVWVNNALTSGNTVLAAKDLSSNKKAAQSLVRRLDSGLHTLTGIINTLRFVVDNSVGENIHEVLAAELIADFPDCKKNTLQQTLNKIATNAADRSSWLALISARAKGLMTDKLTALDGLIEKACSEAEKANRKSRDLTGDSQAFFSEMAAFFQSFSSTLTRKVIVLKQTLDTEYGSKTDSHTVMPLPQSATYLQQIKDEFNKNKLKLPIIIAHAVRPFSRLSRIIRHGSTTRTPSKKIEDAIIDSIFRSVLWQWQQPAIKLQHASRKILVKVSELKKIEGMFSSDLAQQDSDITVNRSDIYDIDTQVRQWVDSRAKHETTQSQIKVKLAVLIKMLESDIANADTVLKRIGESVASIQDVLECQYVAVNKMVQKHLSPEIADALWKTVKKFVPEIAADLANAVQALNTSLIAAKSPAFEFLEAERHADKALLWATKIVEDISTRSAWWTGRPLEQYSRGSRLARHWANLADEISSENWIMPDAEHVLTLLKKYDLLEDTLSSGDSGGYLFATRLAGELANIRNNERSLPFSPENYVALEKNFIEFIVNWGQKRTSGGIARLIIELCFGQAVDTITFGVTNVVRIPYECVKASIKIPYKLNKVNNYTMPGQDKPYKAIYSLLGNNLSQFGFRLITAPLPGMLKLAMGSGITASTGLYNLHIGQKEHRFGAVYEHIVENKKSKKLKMRSADEMLFDSLIDGAFIAGFKGLNLVWGKEGEKNYVSNGVRAEKSSEGVSEERLSQLAVSKKEIACPEGNKFIVHGNKQFIVTVEEHIQELQKHASGQTLLKYLSDKTINIWPPLDKDFLRKNTDGKSYFGSRVIKGAIFFDPYNKHYRQDLTNNDEEWRDVDPSIVLFHELLHIYKETDDHQQIITDDPKQLDENDYRREFYQSKNSKVILRRFSKFDNSDSQFAAIKKQEAAQQSKIDEYNNTPYNKFTNDKKKATYLFGIRYVLSLIEKDESLSKCCRDNAYLARIGAKKTVPVDVYGDKLNNTFLIPDGDGSKSGVLVRLDSQKPYYYIKNGQDLLDDIKWALPHNSDKRPYYYIGIEDYEDYSSGEVLQNIKTGAMDFNYYFNYYNPKPINITSLASELANTIENDYKLREITPTNKLLIPRAIAGSQIPDPGVTATEVDYKLEYTWESLKPAEYLKSFARPFSTLSGQVQLIVSDIKGETIQETEQNVQKAEYIGSWVDVSIGAITSFSPAGMAIGLTQSIADITANAAEGKAVDPLSIAGIIVSSIPGGKIAARVGKFSAIGSQAIVYSLMLGNKAIDLTSTGFSIAEAVRTGEPLAIYQALLATGMSSNDTYQTAKNISSHLNINKKLEDSAQPEQLKALQNDDPVYAVSETMPVRKFNIGQSALLGKIDNGEIWISRDNGINWSSGNQLHLLAYRLQNAGGNLSLPKIEKNAAKGNTDSENLSTTREITTQQSNAAHDKEHQFLPMHDHVSETAKKLQHKLFSDGPHADKLRAFRDKPKGLCYEAMVESFDILTRHGEAPEVIGILIYNNPWDTGSTSHFATVIKKEAGDFVVDPTIRQFDANLPDSATILPYKEWEKIIKVKTGNSDNSVILLKIFQNPLQAKRVVADIGVSSDKFYQTTMIKEENIQIIKSNDKFLNTIVMEIKNNEQRIRQFDSSSQNAKDIQRDISNLEELRIRYDLLSPDKLRPSKKFSRNVKQSLLKYSVPANEIAAIKSTANDQDIFVTVYGKSYIKLKKDAYLRVEGTSSSNHVSVLYNNKKELTLAYQQHKQKWTISDDIATSTIDKVSSEQHKESTATVSTLRSDAHEQLFNKPGPSTEPGTSKSLDNEIKQSASLNTFKNRRTALLLNHSDMPVETPLSKISMLGSHDAGTYDFKNLTSIGTLFPFAYKTQAINLKEQAVAGARYFDIRIAERFDKTFGFFHGSSITTGNAVEEVRDLLKHINRDNKNFYLIKFDFKELNAPSNSDLHGADIFLSQVLQNYHDNMITRKDTPYLASARVSLLNENKNLAIMVNKYNGVGQYWKYNQQIYTKWPNQADANKTADFIKELDNTPIPDNKIILFQTNMPFVSLKNRNTSAGVKHNLLKNAETIASGIEQLQNPAIISGDYIGVSTITTQRFINKINFNNRALVNSNVD